MIKKLNILLGFALALLVSAVFVPQAFANSYSDFERSRHHFKDFSFRDFDNRDEFRREMSKVRSDFHFDMDRLRHDLHDNRQDFFNRSEFREFFSFFNTRHADNFRNFHFGGQFDDFDRFKAKENRQFDDFDRFKEEHHKDGEENVAKFFTNLSGEKEVPGPGDPDGTGTAVTVLNPENGQLCVELQVEGIAQATAAHIHRGEEGVAGDVVVTLPTPNESGFASECGNVDDNLLQQIKDNPTHYYINVHNDEYPDGAVRGQLS